MIATETTRKKYRPETIATLFIRESAPHSGKFFYCGENSMLRELRSVMETWMGKQLGDSGEFLKTFKALGWYLDDLVLTPINHLSWAERMAECHKAEISVARRLGSYRPQAIVALLMGIAPFVARAAKVAVCESPQYVVAFPGMGHQRRFHAGMAATIGNLPINRQTAI